MSLQPEVRRGGNLPFGMVASRWICDPRYSANLRTLYGILVSYADTGSRDTRRGRPYRRELAAQLGVSVATLDRTLEEGEVAGMLTVERRTDPANPARNDASVYHLHDAGVMWHDGGEWTDPLPPGASAAQAARERTEARRAAKRAAGLERTGGVPKGVNSRAPRDPHATAQTAAQTAAENGPGQPDHPAGGGSTGAATPGSTHAATLAARVLPKVYNPVHTPHPEPGAPAARSAPNARRAPHVSTRPSPSGPPAASRKPPPAHPRAGRLPVLARTVIAALPFALRAQLPPDRPLPRQVHAALADALAERTPGQISARIERRWVAHGYEIAADPRAGGTGLQRPIGVLLSLLGPGPCPDPRCEDGTSIDTGERCARCRERREERAGRVQPPPAPAAQPGPPRAPHAATGPARCPQHPGAATRTDPATGRGQCAGCWGERHHAMHDTRERTAA